MLVVLEFLPRLLRGCVLALLLSSRLNRLEPPPDDPMRERPGAGWPAPAGGVE